MRKISLVERTNENVQSIGELWESVSKLAQGRHEDNILSEEYPIEVREHQMITLKCLVNAIEEFHNKIFSEDND